MYLNFSQGAAVLPAQLETLPVNFITKKFQSLFLVVCVMCQNPEWI